MGAMASQITGSSIVYSTVGSDADQRKHQNSASLAFVRGIHRWPVNSQHKRPVTRKMFPFDDVIMKINIFYTLLLDYHACERYILRGHWLIQAQWRHMGPWLWITIGSGNGLAPIWHQGIVWNNGYIWSIGHREKNFDVIWIKNTVIFIEENAFKDVVCKTTAIVLRPPCINYC